MLYTSNRVKSNGPPYKDKMEIKENNSKIMTEKIASSILYR